MHPRNTPNRPAHQDHSFNVTRIRCYTSVLRFLATEELGQNLPSRQRLTPCGPQLLAQAPVHCCGRASSSSQLAATAAAPAARGAEWAAAATASLQQHQRSSTERQKVSYQKVLLTTRYHRWQLCKHAPHTVANTLTPVPSLCLRPARLAQGDTNRGEQNMCAALCILPMCNSSYMITQLLPGA
jgi:hypothetical protein